MNPFKEGDRVTCINNADSNYLVCGDQYTIGRPMLLTGLILIIELGYSYDYRYFIPVYNFPTLRENYGGCGGDYRGKHESI